MKKLFLLSLSLVLASFSAQIAEAKSYYANPYVGGSEFTKSSFYIGADGLISGVNHRYSLIDANATGDLPNNTHKGDNGRFGFGFNVGYRTTFGNAVFIAPEIFYDKIRSRSQDFYFNDIENPAPFDRMEVKDRYGAKLNLGYNLSHLASATGMNGGFGKFVSGISIFGTAGIAKVSYSYHLPSIAHIRVKPADDDSNKVAPIYGFGISYAISDHVSLKLAADIQQFAGRYVDNGLRDSITIKTGRVGLAYYF